MNWKNFKIIVTFLTLLVLSACGDDACVRGCDSAGNNCTRECGSGHCIDADDWGFAKVRVSAESKDLNLRVEPMLNQYADAIDSGQVLLDAYNINLVMSVGKRDQWTSWFGGDINPSNSAGIPDPDGFDGGRTVPDVECMYYLPPGKTSPDPGAVSHFDLDLSPATLKVDRRFNTLTPNPIQKYASPDNYADIRAPCYFRYGMGLYVGLAPNNDSHSSPDDVVLSYHIPDSKRPNYAYDRTINNAANLLAQARDGYLVRGKPAEELPGAQTGDRLYFKIVDRTYIDNSGGYTVKIKEGTRSASQGPLEKISGIFIDPMKIVMNRLYNGIVQNTGFINAVRAVLVLYVAFFGFVFLIGGVAEAKKEALTKLVKMGIVITVISPGSWDFFYNHLFRVFFGGTQEIAGLLMNPFGSYDPHDPWYSMDKILAMFWSSETWAKIWSTLFSNYIGILFIPAIGLAIGVFMLAVVRALIVYLLAFGGMAILVVIAPIFIIFMLFTKTNEMAKEWLDQFFVFALQQIILLAALGMFAAIIVMFLERTIGYNVCWNIFSPLDVMRIHIFDFKFWMPDISTDQASIWIDAAGDGIKTLATRYIDIPYFDTVFDKAQIAKYSSEKNFLSLFDVLMLITSVFLMQKFMALVPTIAKTLKSGAAKNSSDMFSAGGKLAASFTATAVSAVSGVISAGQSIRGGIKSLASNNEARYAGSKVKRAGVTVAGNMASSVANSSVVKQGSKYGSYARMKAGEGLNAAVNGGIGRLPGVASQRASAAQSRIEAAFSPHEGEANYGEAHEFATRDALILGANLSQNKIRGGGDGTQADAQYRANMAATQALEAGLSKLASRANMSILSEQKKNELAMPILQALSTKGMSGATMARIARKSPADIRQLKDVLGSQLQDATRSGKISMDDAKIIAANLNRLERAANAGIVARSGVQAQVERVDRVSPGQLSAKMATERASLASKATDAARVMGTPAADREAAVIKETTQRAGAQMVAATERHGDAERYASSMISAMDDANQRAAAANVLAEMSSKFAEADKGSIERMNEAKAHRDAASRAVDDARRASKDAEAARAMAAEAKEIAQKATDARVAAEKAAIDYERRGRESGSNQNEGVARPAGVAPSAPMAIDTIPVLDADQARPAQEEKAREEQSEKRADAQRAAAKEAEEKADAKRNAEEKAAKEKADKEADDAKRLADKATADAAAAAAERARVEEEKKVAEARTKAEEEKKLAEAKIKAEADKKKKEAALQAFNDEVKALESALGKAKDEDKPSLQLKLNDMLKRGPKED